MARILERIDVTPSFSETNPNFEIPHDDRRVPTVRASTIVRPEICPTSPGWKMD